MRTPSLFFLRTAALGAMVFAFGFARPALIPSVHAADEAASSSEGTVDVDYLFGGDAGSADEFGGATGLGTGDLTLTIAAVIRALLGFLGLIAVFVILLGGWKWMMSQGVEQKVTDAKKLMINGIIGLVVILGAYAISYFALNAATTAFQSAESASE